MYCAIRERSRRCRQTGPGRSTRDEVFSDDGRWRGGGDGPDGVGGRLRQSSVVIDVNIGISHLGYEYSQLSTGFLGDGAAD
jgi:hypothetical protein